MLKAAILVAALGIWGAACGGGSSEAKTAVTPQQVSAPVATATLEPRSGSHTSGSAALTPLPDGSVQIVVRLQGASPGGHGIHVHENGDCGAADASSAGAHFNPDQTTHGAPDHPPHHAGDLGNIQVGPDGSGSLTLALKDVTLGDDPRSLIGKAIVVHDKADDLASQPAGNSGARVACGVIRKTARP